MITWILSYILKDKLTTKKIPTLGREVKNGQKFLDFVFKRPVVNANLVSEHIGLSPKASNDLLRDFVKLGILKEVTGYKRNRMFVFAEYLKILKR